MHSRSSRPSPDDVPLSWGLLWLALAGWGVVGLIVWQAIVAVQNAARLIWAAL